jgi:hypothetical protein
MPVDVVCFLPEIYQAYQVVLQAASEPEASATDAPEFRRPRFRLGPTLLTDRR